MNNVKDKLTNSGQYKPHSPIKEAPCTFGTTTLVEAQEASRRAREHYKSISFERFKQLWEQAGLNNPPKHENPLVMEGASQHTIDALVAASEGDFTVFNKAYAIMAKRDAEDTKQDSAWSQVSEEKMVEANIDVWAQNAKRDAELFCRRTPEETYAYFKSRFSSFLIDPVEASMRSAML